MVGWVIVAVVILGVLCVAPSLWRARRQARVNAAQLKITRLRTEIETLTGQVEEQLGRKNTAVVRTIQAQLAAASQCCKDMNPRGAQEHLNSAQRQLAQATSSLSRRTALSDYDENPRPATRQGISADSWTNDDTLIIDLPHPYTNDKPNES